MSQLWFLFASNYHLDNLPFIATQSTGRLEGLLAAWTGPPHAHRSNERVADAASYSNHCGRIVLIILFTDQWCQSFVEDLSRSAHALVAQKTKSENEPCSASWILSSYFLLFSLSSWRCITGSWWGETVTGCIWVERTNIVIEAHC